MEIAKRESTLEVLKRLQAKNKRPIPDLYKKPPVIVKIEDIIDEDRLSRFNPPKTKILPTGKYTEHLRILNEINNIEKQLKSGKSYFDAYYDLRKKEDKLLKICDSLSKEEQENLPENVIKKVKEIKKKFNK